MSSQQFDKVGDAFTAGYLRMAGETELPGELNALRNLLLKGRLEDHTGAVTVTRDGSFEVAPSNSSWGLRGSFGHDPSVMVNYESKRSGGMSTAPSQSLDNALTDLGAVQGRSDWANEAYDSLSPSEVAALQMGVKGGKTTMVQRDFEKHPLKEVIRNDIPYLGPSPSWDQVRKSLAIGQSHE